jgi:hypothetical protein
LYFNPASIFCLLGLSLPWSSQFLNVLLNISWAYANLSPLPTSSLCIIVGMSPTTTCNDYVLSTPRLKAYSIEVKNASAFKSISSMLSIRVIEKSVGQYWPGNRLHWLRLQSLGPLAGCYPRRDAWACPRWARHLRWTLAEGLLRRPHLWLAWGTRTRCLGIGDVSDYLFHQGWS